MASLQSQIFDLIQESQYWPKDALRAYQESQLSQLIAHARATVPYYRHRLDGLFRSDGSIDWSRWHDLPVLTRSDLRDHGAELCTSAPPTGHGEIRDSMTSGSSGTPVHLRQNLLFLQATNVAGRRFALWAGITPEMTFATLAAYFPRHLDEAVNVHELPAQSTLPGRGRRLVVRRTLPPAALLDLLAAEGVEALGGNVNLIEIMARENARRAQPVRLAAVMFYGVQVHEAQIRTIADSFGARCFDTYSAEETGRIASQCAPGSAYHINAEQMLVEVVDSSNRSVAPGQEGRILVTPFLLTAQPLIRYELGDLAVAGEACSCGRSLPTIARLTGRQDPLFLDAGGRAIFPHFDHELIIEALHCQAYQLAQTAPLAVVVRYIPGSTAPAAPALAAIRAMILKVMPEQTTVTFMAVEGLPDHTGRKIQRIVREFSPAGTQ